MLVTLSGIVMLVRFSQDENALFPIKHIPLRNAIINLLF